MAESDREDTSPQQEKKSENKEKKLPSDALKESRFGLDEVGFSVSRSGVLPIKASAPQEPGPVAEGPEEKAPKEPDEK